MIEYVELRLETLVPNTHGKFIRDELTLVDQISNDKEPSIVWSHVSVGREENYGTYNDYQFCLIQSLI